MPSNTGTLVRPRHRTRVTIVTDENDRTRRVVEVCDDWVTVDQWKEWVRNTTVANDLLVRRLPRTESIDSYGSTSTSPVSESSDTSA